jgi:2-methylcitrate dehydratase PrpD
MLIAEEYAGFAAKLKYARLPAEVIKKAKDLIMDTVGVALAAAKEESSGAARRAAAQWGTGNHFIWGFPGNSSMLGASLANGTMAHTLDYDDTHTGGIVHGSACIIPAAVAAAEYQNRDGRDLIKAIVAGWELAARIGLAAPGKFHERGFHTTSVAGTFGATLAVATLLELTERQTVHALGISGSMVSGVNEYLSNESWPKRFHAGWAAHNGIVASTLAAEGFTGPPSIFEGRYGLYKAYTDLANGDLKPLTQGLGSVWEIRNVSLKPYPCCHFSHAIIDAVRDLKTRQRISPDQVEKILCSVPEVAVPIICEPRHLKINPNDSYGAKFSLPVIVSLALMEPEIKLDTFARRNVRRADILKMARKVEYEVDRDLPFPKYFPGRVRMALKGGKALEKYWAINRGHPDSPMAEKDLYEKFLENAQTVFARRDLADKIREQILSLEDHPVREWTETLGRG